jgi:DNA-binding MarR family transcriptional regulator
MIAALNEAIAGKIGIEPATVSEVIRLLELFGLVEPGAMDRSNRDLRIYELRAQMTEEAIAVRFDLAPRHVRRIVRTQMALRRVI